MTVVQKRRGRPMLPASGFGIALRTRRLEKGMTLRQLSAEVGCSYAALSQFERGKHNPRLTTLVRICNALDLKLAFTMEEN